MGGGEGFQMPHYLIEKTLSPRLEPRLEQVWSTRTPGGAQTEGFVCKVLIPTGMCRVGEIGNTNASLKRMEEIAELCILRNVG